MNKNKFLKLMQFSGEWLELDMYPDELAKMQISGYQPGHEEASEHVRCGAFHWWLHQNPNESTLIKLMKLASKDPDPLMGNDIRSYIQRADSYTENVEAAW